MGNNRSSKRTVQDADLGEAGAAQNGGSSRATPRSLSRAVSPPLKKRRASPEKEEESLPAEQQPEQQPCPFQRVVKSPFHLTTIRSLGQGSNKDTVSLKDLLGDPLIKECWEFNYLHDIDYLMSAFDGDVRHLIKVHVIHGFWKKEDPNRAACKPLVDQLSKYDFSSVRGSLIASVPGRHSLVDDFPIRWGWAAMKETLKSVLVRQADPDRNDGEKPEIVIQISSIATLGPTDNWLKNTLFEALSGSQGPKTLLSSSKSKPDFKIIFPTPDEIRKSLDGYASGGSIHTKIQSAQQAKQLQYLRPMFCHWANDSADGIDLDPSTTVPIREAGRQRAAPHIKTFIRFANNKTKSSIDWALLTSANLSKQAWGDAQSKNNAGEPQVRICSYEIGVLVWPELFADGASSGGGKKGGKAVMVPTFLTDTPSPSSDNETSFGGEKERGKGGDEDKEEATLVVGLRMPYNLPLQRYGPQEVPWVATANHLEPDWMGQVWRHE
ncbi:hypothetical protein N0V85_002055 [Neurospora sp. IMI 360204]|nr:hypothetical protein N0V85_002055 [Neurospora sp. IMI 360204]